MPFFDVSARGLSRKGQLISKGQHTFSVAGPWLTTADEIADPHALRVRSSVNGQPRQDYSTSDMAHHIAKQISWLTQFVELNPGDVLATGTHHNGLGPINPSDTLEIEIDGLGRATFTVGVDSPKKVAGFNVWAGPMPKITELF